MKREIIRYNCAQSAPCRFDATAQFKARAYDWNGDGLPDLVDVDSAFGPRGILVFTNTGTKGQPRFRTWERTHYPIHPGSGYGTHHTDAKGQQVWEDYYGFEVTDWNRNGLPDFISGTILHINVGTRKQPRFERRGPIHIGGKPYPYISKYTICLFADLDGDGKRDLLISSYAAPLGVETGVSWSPGSKQIYQDSAKPGWDVAKSRWPVPRLHFCKNVGTDREPRFDSMEEVRINGEPAGEFIHGWAMPEAVDWRGDGFADLVLGDTSRCIRYFRNLRVKGTPQFEVASLPLGPGFAKFQPDHIPGGMKHVDHPVCPIPRHLNDSVWFELPIAWLRPNAVDWDGDGDLDLVVTANDHSVWIIENTGTRANPSFARPRQMTYLPEDCRAAPVAVDNVPAPQVVDWDGDGRRDLILGGEQGRIFFFKNVARDGGWEFEAPVPLRQEDGKEIWLADICDGYFDGIWCPGAPLTTSDFFGYVEPTVIDLDGDGDLDMICGDISLHLRVIENVGTRTQPRLKAPYPIKLNGEVYSGGWRCRPGAMDFDGDGVVEVVHPGRDGVFHMYKIVRIGGELALTDDRVLRDAENNPLRAGSQRLHTTIADWDGNGLYDLLIGYLNGRVIWARNVGSNREPRFAVSELLTPSEEPLHDCGVDVVDWYGTGKKDLVQATECGYLLVYTKRGRES